METDKMADRKEEFTLTGIGIQILEAFDKTESEVITIMSQFMLACSIFVFLALYMLKAPYGRYANTKVYGFGIHGKVAWFLQELPSFMIPVYLAVFTDSSGSSKVGRVLVAVFLVHYFQRTFIFPFLLRGGKVTPVVPFILALVFCCYNGFMQGAYLLHVSTYQDWWFSDPRFVIGIALFFLGLVINIHSDSVLRNLRKPGETGYKIPEGGLFNYVSGANFLGEIVEWMGFAIACWSLPAVSFCIFSSCNIGHRAMHHHEWYLQKFDDYPKNRKALIPFLF
ncbi:3-oxo-5-alpha-steroid 4-dehydrogenase 1-like [Apostichopus japonicus]|uniref:3-oxo-5-alpha-steroid 4-dehydrogenase 1-like n=1 Tax=Stichopus japonicus TaxID=307972 RepID=UPI003AB9033C